MTIKELKRELNINNKDIEDVYVGIYGGCNMPPIPPKRLQLK